MSATTTTAAPTILVDGVKTSMADLVKLVLADAGAVAELEKLFAVPLTALPVHSPMTGGEWLPISTDGKTIDARVSVGQIGLLDTAFMAATLAKAS